VAFDVAPTGGPSEHVRLVLAPGTGHGARITLVVTGTDIAGRDAAAEMWGIGAVGHLAASGAEWAMAQPVRRPRHMARGRGARRRSSTGSQRGRSCGRDDALVGASKLSS
jgi:hypothetical protein